MGQFCVWSVCVFSREGDCDSFAAALSLGKSAGCRMADLLALVRCCQAPAAPSSGIGELWGGFGEAAQTGQPDLASGKPVKQVVVISVSLLERPHFRKCYHYPRCAFVVCCVANAFCIRASHARSL